MKTAVQLDFDGTITEEDVSYLLLDTYAGNGWRTYLEAYESGKITVGAFNKLAFSLVKASLEEMEQLIFTSPHVKVRPGFREFIRYCQGKEYFVQVTSNGLRFYVEAILQHQGITGVDIHAAENEFIDGQVDVCYLGPDGNEVDTEFKTAFTRQLKEQGFTVIYTGNGKSDIYSARMADYVFATEDLLAQCRQEGLAHTPFKDFNDILAGIKSLYIS